MCRLIHVQDNSNYSTGYKYNRGEKGTTDFTGINAFGSLTTQNGKRLQFKDFDINNDGQISEAEFKRTLSNYKLDSLELSSMDSNKDSIVTEEEFANFETEAEMNDVLNEFINSTILTDVDLVGTNLELGQQVTAELKEWAEAFKAQYTGDSTQMIEEFKAQLQAKFEEVRADVLYNSPDEVRSRVIDAVLQEISTEIEAQSDVIGNDVAKNIQKTLGKKLESLSSKFVESYTGDNLEADMLAYLKDALNTTDKEKMTEALEKLNSGYHTSTDYIDTFKEFPEYKEQVKEFLMEAINNGLTLRMNGVNIVSEASIDTLLKKYDDDEALRNDLNELINTFSDDSIKEVTINNAISAKAAAEEAAFQKLTGEDVKVDTAMSSIDYSKIPNYNEGSTTTIVGQGADGAKDDAMQILTDTLKPQLKSQLESKLAAKGVPFEKFESIFENTFNQCAQDTINCCVSGKDQIRFLWITWRESSSSFNTKTLVDTFLTKFNESIATTIDTMNANTTDMDIQNIDLSLAATNADGTVDEELDNLINNGGSRLFVGKHAEDNVEELGGKMIDRLKGTMLAKSMAMCEANGIEFNNDAFSNIYNTTKELASLSSSRGGLPWIQSFKPQDCVNNFLTSFKGNYTAWVESEKQKV